jgi:hypothetical protein
MPTTATMDDSALRQDAEYLQVRNSAGELVGLLRGAYPLTALRSGWVSFAVPAPNYDPCAVDAELLLFERLDLPVRVWRQGGEMYWCALSDLSVDRLRRIRHFR